MILTGQIKAEQFALMEIGLALKKLLIKRPETSHSAEIFVLWRTDNLKKRSGATCRDRFKEVIAEFQDNIFFKESFQPEVALLGIDFLQLLDRQIPRARFKPAQPLLGH